MRVTVHDFAGHPFQAQLSRELARRGHEVTHRWSPDVASGQGALARRDGDPALLEFVPVQIGHEFERYSAFARLRDERAYGQALMAAVEEDAPDVVLSGNTPITAQARLARQLERRNIGFVFWLQDVLSIGSTTELERRLGAAGRLLGRGLQSIERRSLTRADGVVAITNGFDELLDTWAVSRDVRTVIENWTPLDEVEERPRDNAWASQHGFGERPVFLYAGTLGLKHDPAAIKELVLRVRGLADVVVISQGIGADWLRQHAASDLGETLHVLPYQPWESLPDVLGTADVLLALLEPEAGVFSVPSKVLTGHAAGRPQLAAIPGENLAAQIIEREGSGLVVEPGRHDAFADAAIRLLEDPELRQTMGARARAYAETAFDIARITIEFEAVLQQAVARRSAR